MKIFRLIVVVMLAAIFLPLGSANPTNSQRIPARVSVVTLIRALAFEPKTRGFVIIALNGCSVLINGKMATMKSGDYREVLGNESLRLKPVDATVPQLVLVEILPLTQPLTIEAVRLSPQQELEDASDRGETLMIALSDFRVRDERNLADEDEPWKSSPARVVHLRLGKAVWIRPGVHRMQNTGSADAKFITIEW